MDLRGAAHGIRSAAGRVHADTIDAKALQAMAPLADRFLPWTTFSMRPAAILAILTDITLYQRRQIVECGSGNSTVFVARLLREQGVGHLTSLEHDARWLAVTQRLLDRESLGQHVTLVHAPLRDGWYQADAVPVVEQIDLLVVDGPPSHPGSPNVTIRGRALDAFSRSLTDNASVLLDDARRDGERRVINSWAASHGRKLHQQPGGFALQAPHLE